jgi:hypothetical protein
VDVLLVVDSEHALGAAALGQEERVWNQSGTRSSAARLVRARVDRQEVGDLPLRVRYLWDRFPLAQQRFQQPPPLDNRAAGSSEDPSNADGDISSRKAVG